MNTVTYRDLTYLHLKYQVVLFPDSAPPFYFHTHYKNKMVELDLGLGIKFPHVHLPRTAVFIGTIL